MESASTTLTLASVESMLQCLDKAVILQRRQATLITFLRSPPKESTSCFWPKCWLAGIQWAVMAWEGPLQSILAVSPVTCMTLVWIISLSLRFLSFLMMTRVTLILLSNMKKSVTLFPSEDLGTTKLLDMNSSSAFVAGLGGAGWKTALNRNRILFRPNFLSARK